MKLQFIGCLIFSYFFLNLLGCTQPLTSTLLTSNSGCTDITNCGSGSTSTIAGDLAIAPDPVLPSNIADSDLVEISGACTDLGRKSNKILVQVYEGENDAQAPVIDNSIDANCQDNISTSSLTSLSGGPKTCIYMSQGVGVVDSALGTSVSQYPQCFNGRFSFKVRLGKVIRQDLFTNDQSDITNPRINYLVKLRLRTTEGIISDSGTAKVVVNRSIFKPSFSVESSDGSGFRCTVKVLPSIFSDIRYSIQNRAVGPTHFSSTNFTSATLLVSSTAAVFPLKNDGTGVENFWHFGFGLDHVSGLLPGITYYYSVQAEDFNYRTDYLTQYSNQFEPSGFSAEVPCTISAPRIQTTTNDANSGSCNLTLVGYNPNYPVEWRYTELPDWQVSTPNDGLVVSGAFFNFCQSFTCLIGAASGTQDAGGNWSIPGKPAIDSKGNGIFQKGHTYYLSARQYKDTFPGGIGPEDLVGEWSPSSPSINPALPTTNICTIPP